jgi:hypothetical protein
VRFERALVADAVVMEVRRAENGSRLFVACDRFILGLVMSCILVITAVVV